VTRVTPTQQQQATADAGPWPCLAGRQRSNPTPKQEKNKRRTLRHLPRVTIPLTVCNSAEGLQALANLRSRGKLQH